MKIAHDPELHVGMTLSKGVHVTPPEILSQFYSSVAENCTAPRTRKSPRGLA
jgi:hypothetical protein